MRLFAENYMYEILFCFVNYRKSKLMICGLQELLPVHVKAAINILVAKLFSCDRVLSLDIILDINRYRYNLAVVSVRPSCCNLIFSFTILSAFSSVWRASLCTNRCQDHCSDGNLHVPNQIALSTVYPTFNCLYQLGRAYCWQTQCYYCRHQQNSDSLGSHSSVKRSLQSIQKFLLNSDLNHAATTYERQN